MRHLLLDDTRASLGLPDFLLLRLALRQLHALGVSLGQELAHALLVDLVLGVLARGDELGEPCASLEQDEIAGSTRARPVQVRRGLQAAPLVQAHPERLLKGEVGVARPAEQARGVEATVELLARVAVLGRDLCGLLVGSLGFVVVPLLAVGEELHDDDEEHEAAEDGVVTGEFVAGDAGAEEEEVCGGGDEPEEDLIG
jgi:hypothetical protein